MNTNSHDTHFMVSLELLHLLKWLLENEPIALRKIITHALSHGLQETLKSKHTLTAQYSSEELQQQVVEFFSLLEALLLEALYEDEAQQTLQRSLIPAIKYIDAQSCDQISIASSVAKATEASGKKSKEHLKEILCKELLKRWKPQKRASCH
ncbi:MAG: hypothetical protein WA432_00115 [Candidatus Babeliaceae bacterium]